MFKKIASIVKYELKWFGTFGIGAQLAGMVFVQRSNKENATSTLNKALKKAKDTETSLLIFPEGTRHLASSDGECMLPFKKGAFHMAIDAGLPILPVVISEYDFIDRKRKSFGSPGERNVTITVLAPVETSDLEKSDIDNLITDTRSKMIDVFKAQKDKTVTNGQTQHLKSE